MSFFRDYKKQILTLAAVILVITALITMGKKTNATFFENTLGFVITPMQSISSQTQTWLGDKITSFKDQTDIYNENEELKAQIKLLEAENKRLTLYEEENKKLSELLDISQKYPEHNTTAATIIAKDPGNWYDTFVINKGTSKDIAANMVLMASGGLVGKITETGATYSKAMSILDRRSSVSAMSLRSGDLGIVKGETSLMNDGLCRMEYIDADSQIVKGDEIVTSSLSDIYPAGITIGFVKEIITDTDGLTKYAIIEPLVDFKHLDTLLIITGEKNGSAAQ